MYGQGAGSVLGSSTTGVSGAVSVLGGVAVLPNTGGSLALTILGFTTVAVGSLILASFLTTKLVTRYYR